MARPPAPPGPPPPHYRPPGTPRSPVGAPAPVPSSPGSPTGIGPGAATAVAVLTLLVGLVAGFFLGRAYGDEESAATRTTGTIAPSPTAPTTSLPFPTRPPGDTIPQQPGGPPSTDLEPGRLGTIDDPIPAGQAYVLGLYEVEVLGVERDAAATLDDFDPSNPAAPDGSQHVLVELAVRFTDASGLGAPGSIPFFVSDGDQQWSALDAGCGRIPDDLAGVGFIEQGEEAVGRVCFTVPSGAVADLVLGTESFAGPLWFALP